MPRWQQLRRGGARIGAGVAAVALLGPLMAYGAAGAAPLPVATEQIVVMLASPQVRASAVLGTASAAVFEAPAHRYVLQVPDGKAAAVLERLRADSRVAYASVAQRVHADEVGPDDPCYRSCGPTDPRVGEFDDAGNVRTVPGPVNQANLTTVDAPGAWSVTEGSPGVLVAVLDSGVDTANPDLTNVRVGEPTLCADDPVLYGPSDTCTPGTDVVGHGSHVSGIIGATTDNDLGVAGLGWKTTVETWKVLDDEGNGTTTDVATGIYDAVAAGARVINMSLSNDSCDVDPNQCGPDPDEEAAVSFALAHGVVVVAAAGNDDSTEPTYPAGYPGVLSVAATDDQGTVDSTFSQYGPAANIAAPGVDVVSTWNGDGGYDYFELTGTSMAAPHVAAAAALVIAANPSLTGPQVTALLESTAGPTAAGETLDGGVLDVGAAVRAALNPTLGGVNGYQLAGADGSVYNFGSALDVGSLTGLALTRPVVGIAEDPNQLGYWMDASDGGVFSFGAAAFHGSEGGHALNEPVVGMAATPDGGGYWLVASDGGIFSFGTATFHGSGGNLALVRPITGMVVSPDGLGYWLVASDGGVFNYGDSRYWGSTGGRTIPAPVVGIAS